MLPTPRHAPARNAPARGAAASQASVLGAAPAGGRGRGSTPLPARDLVALDHCRSHIEVRSVATAGRDLVVVRFRMAQSGTVNGG
jgi:hypothetical protein